MIESLRYYFQVIKVILQIFLNVIVLIPNLPFHFLIAIHLLYHVFNNYSRAEIYLKGSDIINHDELEKIYPPLLEYIIAVFFYIQLYLYL